MLVIDGRVVVLNSEGKNENPHFPGQESAH